MSSAKPPRVCVPLSCTLVCRADPSAQAGAAGGRRRRPLGVGAERRGCAPPAGGHGGGRGPRGRRAAARPSRRARGGRGPPRRRRGVARVGARGGGLPPPCQRDGGAGEARLSLHRLAHKPWRAERAAQAGARRDAAAPAAGLRAAAGAHKPHAQRAGGPGPPILGARRGAGACALGCCARGRSDYAPRTRRRRCTTGWLPRLQSWSRVAWASARSGSPKGPPRS